jgi:hypothetical protein
MAQPPGQSDLFDLVPVVKPLGGSGPVQGRSHDDGHEQPVPLPVEGRYVPRVNYVSDSEEPA